MWRKVGMLLCLACLVLVAACSAQSTVPPQSGQGNRGGPGGPGGPRPQGTTSANTTSSVQFTSSSSPIPTNSVFASLNLTEVPVGDNRTTTSGPQANQIYVCTTSTFSRGGAAHEGPWFNGNGTYNLAAKVHVDGNITWKDPQFSVTVNGSTRVVHTNDLPSVPTGIFPILPNTTAYQYDRNPNAITAQNVTLNLPANPTAAARPSCMAPGGTIGVMLDGGLFYNALDAGGRDAVANEVQDGCWGHPQMNGQYHYHSLTPCMNFGSPGAGTSPLLGYALDGYGIYGPFQDGKLLTNTDLDVCHGTISAVQWDGQTVTMYHYVANFEFPYTVGCYHGTPAQTGGPQG